MLAYVFWHRPAGDPAEYERRLAAFHAALAADPPPGYGGSCALRLGDGGYEDWYLVPDWTALGELNQAAISGSRAASHDAAASRAADGSAGVYLHVAGPTGPPAQPHGAWLDQLPDGYEDAGTAVWRRQMTLGPPGQYTVRAAAPVDLPGARPLSAARVA
jgi:hypothetical protein